jgi:uncharacterized 2Fe-2S/4Fe-4S cluster protein (DUF4445 family)
MRAESGAIYDVMPDGQIQTIRNKPARGVCGSGVFHLLEKFYQSGVLDHSGKILTRAEAGGKNNYRIVDFESVTAVMIASIDTGAARDIFLTQNDIREFQLARSAIVSAWKVLANIAGVPVNEIDRVYIAGAFGNFIRPEAAISLGLVPVQDINKIHFIGNGSLEGSRLSLMDQSLLDAADEYIRTTRFVELAGRAGFQDVYVENMHFPT